jgi:SlyX protein
MRAASLNKLSESDSQESISFGRKLMTNVHNHTDFAAKHRNKTKQPSARCANHTALECTPRPTTELAGSTMNEQRLVNIETKVSFHEDQIEELNKTVYRQQQAIERLEAICEALARELRALADAGNDGKSANERPPHY